MMWVPEFKEREMKYLIAGSMARSLQEFAESTNYTDLDRIKERYRALHAFLCSFDPEAASIIPGPEFINDDTSAKIAIKDLVDYTMGKSLPLTFKMIGTAFSFWSIPAESLSPLHPLLREWNLSSAWAVGALALTLMEVMITRVLKELNMDTRGSFEDKVRRLREKAKEAGIRLPDLLAGPFYRARGKIVHRGAEPTPEELNVVLQYLRALSSSLKQLLAQVSVRTM